MGMNSYAYIYMRGGVLLRVLSFFSAMLVETLVGGMGIGARLALPALPSWEWTARIP